MGNVVDSKRKVVSWEVCMNKKGGEACQAMQRGMNGGAGVTPLMPSTPKSYRELRHTSNLHIHPIPTIGAPPSHLYTPHSY